MAHSRAAHLCVDRASCSRWETLFSLALALLAACNGGESTTAGADRAWADQACASDSDCTLAYDDCMGCERSAIPTSGLEPVDAQRRAACDGYLGPFGECDAQIIVARCEQRACVAREASEVGAAVSTPHEVEVSEAYRACTTDADCTSVETGCDGCCQRAAISRRFVTDYQADRDLACSGYRSGICDCQPRELVAVCSEGICVAR